MHVYGHCNVGEVSNGNEPAHVRWFVSLLSEVRKEKMLV